MLQCGVTRHETDETQLRLCRELDGEGGEDRQVGRMVGWLDGWMVGCLDGWVVGWLGGWVHGQQNIALFSASSPPVPYGPPRPEQPCPKVRPCPA